jgi:micrococcal nuclease
LQLAIGVLELEGAGIWKESFRRTITHALLSNGTNVNYTLVKDGWCWWYRKYVPGDTVLEGLENVAREAKKGLWADPQPVPPWEWRKGSKRVKE